MSATVFYAGTAEFATLTNVFSVSGTATDPTTVTLTVTDPQGNLTTPAVTHSGTGTYTAAVACTADGIWTYTWTGTGTASDIVSGSWTVGPSDLNRNYCSAEELKSRLRISGTADDSELALACAGASRGIDLFCERHFFRLTETRTFVPHDLFRTDLDDVVSVTTLATDPGGNAPQDGSTFPVTWAASDFQLLPVNPNRLGEAWPYRRLRAVGTKTFPWVVPMILQRLDRVQVTGVFGWPAVPWAVRNAALITASELFRAKDTPAGGSVPGEFAIAVIKGNPTIGSLLAPYCRNPVLAA